MVSRGIALLFLGPRYWMGWGVSPTPRPPLPSGKTRYPFYRRLVGPQGRFGRAENIVPTGIRSKTVQPVVSRYTDWLPAPHTATPVVLHTIIKIGRAKSTSCV